MNRKERRAQMHEAKVNRKTHPDVLTEIPQSEWPVEVLSHVRRPAQVWVSKKYLVQVYGENNSWHRGLVRLSIHRTTRNTQSWNDGLNWDEIQSIKHEVGFGDWYGVEVYPRDADVVNVANMRHLWLLPEPLPIGWFGDDKAVQS